MAERGRRLSIQTVAEWLRDFVCFEPQNRPSRERLEAAVRAWCEAEGEPQNIIEIALTRFYDDEIEGHMPALPVKKPVKKKAAPRG